MAIPMPKPADLPVETPAPQFHVLPEPGVPPPEAPSTPVAPRKGLNLGGLTTKKDAKAKGTVHPKATVSPEVALAISQFFVDKPAFESLKGSCEQLRAQILEEIAPQILGASGTEEFSFLAAGAIRPDYGNDPAKAALDTRPYGGQVMVTLQNRYTGADHEATHMALCEIIGEKLTEKYFKQGVVLSVNINKAPEEIQQAILDDLIPIFQKYDIMSGEDPAVVAKQVLVPTSEFHTVRRAVFTKEQNVAIHAILPCVGIVKTKNVRS